MRALEDVEKSFPLCILIEDVKESKALQGALEKLLEGKKLRKNTKGYKLVKKLTDEFLLL